MISEPENNGDNSQPAGFGKSAKQIAILLLIDMAMIVGALACHDIKSIGKLIPLSAAYLHTPIGIWIGIIVTKSYQKKWIVATYWFSVVVPPISFIAPYVFIPLHMFFPFGLVPTSIFIQWSILLGILSKQFTKGRWPLMIAILFAIGGVILTLINLTFRTTEFGPLGMLFVNIFASPVFLIMPALIRIPACNEIKVYVARLQYVTYGFTFLSWIVFGIRVYS
jgi:hypothetical protein